jgi:hypothetical protein
MKIDSFKDLKVVIVGRSMADYRTFLRQNNLLSSEYRRYFLFFSEYDVEFKIRGFRGLVILLQEDSKLERFLEFNSHYFEYLVLYDFDLSLLDAKSGKHIDLFLAYWKLKNKEIIVESE